MEVTVSIPDQFLGVTVSGPEVSRAMIEAFAVESYRQEKMSLGQLAELLDFSLGEADAFLKAHDVPLNYERHDLAEDRRVIEKFLTR
jgi:predicted HTH domain antitoxin